MIDIKSLLNNKKTLIPAWFADHAVLKEIKEVKKIFPSIGLPNFSAEAEIEDDSINYIISSLCSAMSVQMYNAKWHYTISQNIAIIETLEQLRFQWSTPVKIIASFKKKKNLGLVHDIAYGKEIFARAGESIFKVYNKISAVLKKDFGFATLALESLHGFKEYSSANIGGKLKIVFSSDGEEGAWDIITMSQRGIASCQSWNGQFKSCVLGSMLDPFTGIIYLTSGSKTPFGSKMIRRCVVRFVVNPKTKQQSIYLEYMYPSHSSVALNAFKNALKAKIGDKYPIITSGISSYYVPYSSIVPSLLKYSDESTINTNGNHNQNGIFPYRDTFIKYNIRNAIHKDIKTELNTQILKALRKKGISITLNKKVVDVVSTVFSDNSSNIRDVCIKYFMNKNKIKKSITKTFALLKAKPQLLTCLKLNQKKHANKYTKMALESIIDGHLMPVISSVYRKNWTDYMKPKATKSVALNIE